MSRRQLTIGVLILIIAVGPMAAIAETGTYQVDRPGDDLFVTEVGNVFTSSPYIILKDPNYRVTDYVLFRDLTIQKYADINEAVLSVYTNSNQAIDKDAVVYIRGIDLTDPVLYSVGNYSEPPTTSSIVTWNISEVMGLGWHNVTVTPIVKELINRYPWATGQNLGFRIYSVNSVTRQFVAYEMGDTSLTAKLYITYDEAPIPGDPDYPTWLNSTYGGLGNSSIIYWPEPYREFDIYAVNITSSGPKDMVISLGDFSMYYYRLGSLSDPVLIIGGSPTAAPTSYANFRRILRTGDDILYAVCDTDDGGGFDRIILANSTDNGLNWNTDEIVSQWPGMNGSAQRYPSIAQDNIGRIHVAWTSRNPTQTLAHAIRHLNGSWTYYNITHEPNVEGVNMFIDQADTVHFTYSARNASDFVKKQVYYQNQTVDYVIGDQVRLSSDDLGNHLGSSVVAYLNTTPVDRPYIGVSWTRWDGGGTRYCYFRERTAFGWQAAEALSGGGTINQEIALNLRYAADLVGFYDPPYSYEVVWARYDGTRYRIYIAERPIHETPPSFDKFLVTPTDQGYLSPSIMVDEAGDYFTAYYGQTDGDTYRYFYWDVNNTASGHVIDLVNSASSPSLALTSSSLVATLWYGVNENGTVINSDDPFSSFNDLKGFIDGLLGADPLDPDPPGYDETGPFTRFALRRYAFMIGWFMLWGPIWLFCYRRPSGYLIGAAFIFMLIGLGLLLQIPYI